MLELIDPAVDDAWLDAWRARVDEARGFLRWPKAATVVRRHARGAALALAAPLDQLFSATEVNEWALLAALPSARQALPAFHAPGHAAPWDRDSAEQTLRRYAAAERRPPLVALEAAAQAHGVRLLIDDEELSLGGGAGCRSWPLAALPTPDAVDWNALHDIPVALVTGSNGKTTTVRLLAAMLQAQGRRCAYSCTDGLFANGERLRGGDYSGPAGARAVLRHPHAEAAVLETARGGILRRGLALRRADVAVVTNISVDHFGEYGIHDLDGLADAKLVVARTLHSVAAPLVLNADDSVLRRRAPRDGVTLAWFALDDAHAELRAHRAQGGATCGIADDVLRLHWRGATVELGAVEQMPLSFAGRARYNLANIAAASLAAAAMGVPFEVIKEVLTRFGRNHADNPGRLQHWDHDGIRVFVDYAHNADGLRGLLEVANAQRAEPGRLGLLLGQAGNREDAEIRELAAVVAKFLPDRIVLKELSGMLRGRVPGEVPALLREALLQHAVPAAALQTCFDEEAAARSLLTWARAGDVVVLPLHGPAARDTIVALLDRGA